jgi:2,5-dihydroxypyridine 5,6-dioxygenase
LSTDFPEKQFTGIVRPSNAPRLFKKDGHMDRDELTARIDENCINLVDVCADLRADQSALVVSDTETEELGVRLASAASTRSDRVIHRVIPRAAIHGEEPPADVGAEMSDNDVVFGITTMSMTHTNARRAACEGGARFLSLADYSAEALASPALGTDFLALTDVSNRVAEVLSSGDVLTLTTAAGSELVCDIRGRGANAAPGWCEYPGALASPPDAETNVPPLEDGSNGIVIVDGSIPCDEIGLVRSPYTLTIENGRVVNVQGEDAAILDGVLDGLGNPATRVLGEFGIGLNPNATLCGIMLEDEGVLGTCHLGIGSNLSFGGKNDVPFHLDHIIRDVTVAVDGTVVVSGGAIQV